MIKLEIWRHIDGAIGYQVSNHGRVRSMKAPEARILKTKVLPCGYERVSLSNGGPKIYEYIHRLVAKAFIPNADNQPWVNHVDGNKLNNRLDNLEWVTPSANSKHAFRSGLNRITDQQRASFIARTRSILAKRIEQLTIEGTVIRTWDNACDAQKELGFDRANVARAARESLVRYGYRWRYVS